MATNIAPPEPDLPNIRKRVRSRPLWRVFWWGGAAAVALAAVALISQTEAGNQRLQLAIAAVGEPVRAVARIPPRTAETETETKRLAALVRDLGADRERLTARIAMLERNLDDMTGSIKEQSEQLKAARAVNTPPPAPSPPASAPAVEAVAPEPSPPAIAPVVEAVAPPPAPTQAAPTQAAAMLPALTPLAMPVVTETVAAWTAITQPPLPVEPATEKVPVPPVRIAAAPANERDAEPLPPAKLQYGIDLGGAASMEALRIHWAAVKANYGPLLAGLHPLATHYPQRPTGVVYRLVAGPLPTAADAAKLCARFPVTRTGCHPAKFNGAQLAGP